MPDSTITTRRQGVDWLVHRAWRNYWLGVATGLALATVAVCVGVWLAAS